MNIFYKKCDICGEKISKFQNLLNIYFLKTGKKLRCSNCNTLYKTNKVFSAIGFLYTWGGIWILPLLYIVSFVDSFKLNLGIEVWLFAVIIYSLVELIITLVLPLKKIK